jgi:hypothetical protein
LAERGLFLPSIDDYLGPAENRFFARGYQRAEHRIRDIGVTSTRVDARVDLSYPTDWSTKKGVDQRPHLSTVDALVLAVQLVEVHLATSHGLTGPERASARLRRVVLRAGGAPQEDLVDLPVSASLVKNEDLPETAARVLSVYSCAVGNLRVRTEVEHPVGASPAAARTDSLDGVLGPGRSRYYGAGFRTRRHHIQHVQVDMDTLTARADVHFTPEPDPATAGIDGELHPSVTFVDAFVVNLQLAQVLMYELDSLSRANSNTLWMMQTRLDAPVTRPPLPDRPDLALLSRASLTDTRLHALRGGKWRSVDIDASLAGIGLRCSFAHELPAVAME